QGNPPGGGHTGPITPQGHVPAEFINPRPRITPHQMQQIMAQPRETMSDEMKQMYLQMYISQNNPVQTEVPGRGTQWTNPGSGRSFFMPNIIRDKVKAGDVETTTTNKYDPRSDTYVPAPPPGSGPAPTPGPAAIPVSGPKDPLNYVN